MNTKRFVLNALLVLMISICAPAGYLAFAAEPGSSSTVTSVNKLDLNSATADQLMELPGIGPAYAKKIIDNRPYKTTGDLAKAGIPASTIDKISGKVKVSRAASAEIPRSPKRTPMATSQSEKTTATEKTPIEKSFSRAASTEASATSGKVWLNTDSNIYHQSGSRWYGKTKSGKYVSEQEAVDAGARAAKE